MSAASTRPVPRAYTILLGLTTLMILVQAITAGAFVQRDNETWVTVHGITADITWVVALVTAIVALRSMRGSRRDLRVGTAVLFVAVLAQTGIGHLITDGGTDWLIAVHVPLAVLIFGLAIWLSVASAGRRLPAPYGDDASASRAGSPQARSGALDELHGSR